MQFNKPEEGRKESLFEGRAIILRGKRKKERKRKMEKWGEVKLLIDWSEQVLHFLLSFSLVLSFFLLLSLVLENHESWLPGKREWVLFRLMDEKSSKRKMGEDEISLSLCFHPLFSSSVLSFSSPSLLWSCDSSDSLPRQHLLPRLTDDSSCDTFFFFWLWLYHRPPSTRSSVTGGSETGYREGCKWKREM